MLNKNSKYMIVVILLSWSLSSSFAQQTLLNENGGFETGDTTGWETGGVTVEVISGDEVLHGNYSLHLYNLSTVNAWASQARALAGYTFEQGKVYTFSCFIKTEPGVTRDMSMRFQEHGTWTVFPAKNITINDEWTEYYITTDVLTTTYTPARAGWEFGTSAEEIWFDEAKVYEGEYVPTVLIDPPNAKMPNPTAGSTDVPRDVILNWMPAEIAVAHDVYFGEMFEDVNDADISNPLSALVTQNQIPNTYDHPGLLKFGQIYYWRIDEVAADGMVHKGDVWSFTVEPFAYPIENIIATSSSNTPAQEPEHTVNGSGLDDSGLLHGNDSTGTMWLSSSTEVQPSWIAYEFDQLYKLHKMWIWNYNDSWEQAIGVGIKDATIGYSMDGNNLTTLGTTHEFTQGPGTADYAHNTTIDFEGVPVKHVKITANSNWGDILKQYGLSEVRFLYIPVAAREPSPVSSATGVETEVVISWRAGREAVTHDLYFSDDEQAVIDGTAPVETVTETNYGPLSLDLGRTYYWKVNEVNESEAITTWQSNIWSFTTVNFLIIDDMEAYNDIPAEEEGSNLIYEAWIDGLTNPANGGSQVGYLGVPSYEETIVHSGNQSMPIFYDNSTASKSEATLSLTSNRDWTIKGVSRLSIWYQGDAINAAETMYVTLNSIASVDNDDPDATLASGWTEWNIDLQTFADQGVNLSNVNSITLGFSSVTGGTGTIYFDDIRLYAPEQ
jgi:hypothetical protein